MTAQTTAEQPAEPDCASRDWLLTSARVLVTIMMVVFVIAAVGLTIGAVAMPLLSEQVLPAIASQARYAVDGGTIAAISAFMLVMVGITAIAYLWLRELRRIIDSVGKGDSFDPKNALRLERMGWLTVLVEVIAIPGGAFAAWLAHEFHRAHIEVSVSFSGILMALVLFILARVFREGARMREDLEGTV